MMLVKTYTPKPQDIDRQWLIVDAEGQTLGRLASQIAPILRGKHKPTFAPNIDVGDYVIVINVDNFCERAGFATSARFCFTRTEGDVQAEACDYLAVGKSPETGRWGPTWSWDGKPCTAAPGENGCSNHPDNQFLLNTRGDGEYEACVAADIPLSTNPDLPGSRCGKCRISGGTACNE